ncbi:MAG TPA: hypothetical protein VHF27_06065 [Acidimicrobiales bacterium]|nr:hypothetical protein [Acidimicrobiales bacterium]
MNPTSDPLERLRGVNPVPAAAVQQLRPDPVLLRAIVSGELDERRPTRSGPARRRTRLVAPALAVTGLLGGAAAYAYLRDPAPKPQTVGCYEQPDLEARTEVVGVGAEGPLAACAELWEQGVLGEGGEVPPLTECILGTGVVGVFPARAAGAGVCTSLSVPTTDPPTPTTGAPSADVNERFRLFREAVLPQFVDAACVDPPGAADVVRRELARAGLGDWRVTDAGPFSADRPCATLGFRPEATEVLLIPSAPRR